MILKPTTLVQHLLSLALVSFAAYNAYNIRLYAVKDYGKVIHEFDPWFNYRATEYLAQHGWKEFFSWFDHRSWYPLGRPVGTTIYPGMQIISVFLFNLLNFIGIKISLNDVCVFVPAWFGVLATILTGALTYVVTDSPISGGIAAVIMSIIPAHIMRSVAGGFDNESVAISCMVFTFLCWALTISYSEKQNKLMSGVWGVITGFAYICMVASWGGFIFVLNLIASHCALLCITRFNSSLHIGYSLFYIVGTFGAINVPVVGWGPLRSLEQISGLIVFLSVQILQIIENKRIKKNLTWDQVWKLRVQYFSIAVLFAAVAAAQLFNLGYFAPFTARVRALFVKHTRTGNPLVDSVAEHQPASTQSYKQYLYHTYSISQVGFVISCLYTVFYYHFSKAHSISNGSSFIAYYAIVGYLFCNKMSRLILLLGPVASVLSGTAIGFLFDALVFYPFALVVKANPNSIIAETLSEGSTDKKGNSSADNRVSKTKLKKNLAKLDTAEFGLIKNIEVYKNLIFNNRLALLVPIVSGILIFFLGFIPMYKDFAQYSDQMAQRMSHPSIMFKATLQNGTPVMVDDYREAYWWLRDKTPEDSRVLSWWDYGYQISGIGNRTTLADGNTWNHEHIATIGRILTAPPEEAHKIARHLADYVLVWAGGGGDDLAKSPHMARIGNSVYPGLCPGDPTCKHFGFYSMEPMKPTKSMENSLLFKLCQSGITPGVELDSKYFQLVYQSRFGRVRIFKVQNVSEESRRWIADRANKLCDRPGGWYCPGQYPPALKEFISKRVDFKQLEDFNKEKDDSSKKYQEQYHKNMAGKGGYGSHMANEGKPQQNADKVNAQLGIIGCYTNENALPTKKDYVGGVTGAVVSQAVAYAQENGYKYMALARVNHDGHSFFFNELPTQQSIQLDKGCQRECADYDSIYCGCAESGCGQLKAGKGDKHLRRWIVYEV